MKPQNDAELMRTLMEQIHTYHNPPVEENMLTRGLSKAAMKGANWLSKKFGKIGLDWRSLSQYQTPATIKMFQTWMRQYKQSYENVTWNTLNDFFVRNSQLRNIKFTDEITGRTLTKAELAEVFADDRQVLSKILGQANMTLLPKNAAEFNTKVAAKAVIGGGNADAAYAVIVAVVEAALVHMFVLSQPETDAAQDVGAAPASAGATTAGTAAAAPATPGPGAPGTPASGAAAGGAPAVGSLSAEDLKTLQRLLGITS